MRFLSVNVHVFFLRMSAMISGIGVLIMSVEMFRTKDAFLVLEVIISGLVFLCIFKIHLIKYDKKKIYLQSILKKSEYAIEDFRSIETVFPYINFYSIVFNDGRKHSFAVGSSKIILTSKRDGFASLLESEIRKNIQD